MITLYGFKECEPCQQVKRLLEKFGIEYEYIDVLKNNVNFVSVPVLELDDGRLLKDVKDIAKYLREESKKHKVKK